jgi:hypothetical protein
MGSIFLIHDKDTLVEMSEAPYEKEDYLQSILEDYPKLLAGDQIDGEKPRRWLLISREMPVPDKEDAAGRWALDHLFLDQDGIPTLVEVKRSTDTRIRREVAGRMLDYAANAVLYWPVLEIRAQFEHRCEKDKTDPTDELKKSLGPEIDLDKFWTDVKTNLDARRLRLLFVADQIPPELQHIIEFLNGQMTSSEVLGLELKQYCGENRRTLVPRIVGRTSEAQQAKSQRPSPRQWDELSFMDDLQDRCGPDVKEVAMRILEWARSKALGVRWGRGGTYGTFYPVLSHAGRKHPLFGAYSAGKIEIYFHDSPLSENDRQELLRRLNNITDVSIRPEAIRSWASFPLSTLRPQTNLDQFFSVFDWVIHEISRHDPPDGSSAT